MKRTQIAVSLVFAIVVGGGVAMYSTPASSPPIPTITLLRTPHDGIQPQTVLDGDGVLHMIYFKGDASGGNIEYVSHKLNGKDFSEPVRVNSEAGSAIAIGTVRGPQIAVGRNGRVYVIWFGSQAHVGDPSNSMPVFFARLNDSRRAFEPQRNLMQYAKGGDGGISVAADAQSDVYAVWHAMGAEPGENHRRVYLARSTDDGKTFAREVPVSPTTLGACGCCGMRAFVDEHGTLFVLYRAAAESAHRDMTLLTSTDQGRAFRVTAVAPWELNACPMTTAYLSEGGKRVLAAWETAGQVYFSLIDPNSLKLSATIAAPGESNNRKHPAVAASTNGEVLLAWTEGTGWSKGGSLAWQLFDNFGRPVGREQHAPGVPVWGLPSVFANHEGNFTIVY
jgi:hypothetical protein